MLITVNRHIYTLLIKYTDLDAVLLFMSSLIKGQYTRLGTLRAHFFNILTAHNVPDDFVYRLDALRKVCGYSFLRAVWCALIGVHVEFEER